MRDDAPSGKDPAETRPDETVASIAGLRLAQKKRGYRFGLEPILLADFVRPRLRERVVDLGSGCGVVALLLARQWPTLRIWGLELQAELAELAAGNSVRNELGRRCTILRADLREVSRHFPEGRFQRVVSNPPFRPPERGRICPEPQRAIARQELTFTLSDLATAASFLLGHGGVLDFIHLPERLPEIFPALTRRALEPKVLRLVSSFPNSAPELALISARKNGRPGLKVLPPLAVYRSRGRYTLEVDALFRKKR